MPENSRFHAQIVFRTDLRTEEGVDAAELLLKTLTEKCAGFGKKDPAYPVTPRVWVDERDEAYAGFLETFGFRETDRMWVMERKLAGETACRKSEKKQADRDCHISDLTKDLLAGYRPGSGEGPSGELRDYISATEAAFGIPDSFAEMEYRLYCGGGRVFTLDRKSYVTVWPLGEGTFATENVFTRPEHQRSGLCRELLNGAAEILRQEGAERVRLNVYDWNKGAIALYGSVGYEHVRTLREMTAET